MTELDLDRSSRRQGDTYRRHRRGPRRASPATATSTSPGVLADEEVAELEVVYDRFLRREIEVPGKDYCDMAGDYGRRPEDYSIVNVMLPRRYFPAWQGNLYERRAASIAEQLCGPGMVVDYDQLLAKQPFKDDAVFAWHQDMAYWIDTADTRTATCWLAVDDSTVENGCMRFVPGTTWSRSGPTGRSTSDRSVSHTPVHRPPRRRSRARRAHPSRRHHGAQRAGAARLGRQHARRASGGPTSWPSATAGHGGRPSGPRASRTPTTTRPRCSTPPPGPRRRDRSRSTARDLIRERAPCGVGRLRRARAGRPRAPTGGGRSAWRC